MWGTGSEGVLTVTRCAGSAQEWQGARFPGTEWLAGACNTSSQAGTGWCLPCRSEDGRES